MLLLIIGLVLCAIAINLFQASSLLFLPGITLVISFHLIQKGQKSQLMQYICSVLIVSCFLFIGCEGNPPPELSETEYINYAHDFRIIIPEPWEAETDIPEERLKHLRSEGLRVLLRNNSSDGMIIISSDKSYENLDYLKYDKSFRKATAEVYKKMGKEKGITGYNSMAFQPFQPFPSLLGIIEFFYENETVKRRVLMKEYLHPCKGDDTCSVRFLLNSNPITFEMNEKGFNKIIEEFEYDGWINEVY
ncbi:MAG: hypothetical protein HUN04_18350 [Desulfobacter sp.]|nr:MAG: hypothetical protein HUN04_18350 [Desulfobacter sp.]